MSIIRHPDQRVAVLIDTQNLYHSAKNLYKAKVNFQAVVQAAVADRQLVRAISYVVTTESGDETSFFEAMEKVGIEIKTKDLQVFYGGAKKADWDVGIAVDAIKLAHKVDAIVLISGDGDFIPMMEYVRMQGCQVEVATFGRSASSKLRETVDDFIDLDEDPQQYLIGYRPKRTRGKKVTRKVAAKEVSKKETSKKTTRKRKSAAASEKNEATIQTVGSDTDNF